MSRELLQQAYTTLSHARNFIVSKERMHPTGVDLYDKLVYEICDELAKPEQEPVANEKEGSPCPEFWDWLPKAYNFVGDGVFTKYNMETAFLAGKQFSSTAPQRKPWVGLTDEQKKEATKICKAPWHSWAVDPVALCNYVEAKLKEKNI
jgi:hypothetical protein